MSDTMIVQICAAAGAPKQLARLTGASPSSARRWQAGRAAMPADALLRLARRSAAVREALLAALGLDDAACLARLVALEAAIAAARARRLARTRYDPEHPPYALAPGRADCPPVGRHDAAV